MKAGLIDVVESAYRFERGPQEWLQRVAEGLAPAIDQGAGVLGTLQHSVFDPSTGRVVIEVLAVAGVNLAEATLRCFEMMAAEAVDTSIRQRFIDAGPANTLLSTLGGADVVQDGFRRAMDASGFADGRYVMGGDATGYYASFISPSARRSSMSRADRERFSRIAAHVAAGHRIWQALAPAGAALAESAENVEQGADAVMRPDGRIEHVATAEAKTAEALSALRGAARSMDRARGKLRREDPDEALALWRGLCAGTWSLIDRFDSDGRRYVVARRNDASAPLPPPLSARQQQVVGYAAQGHSNKLIAYELGLSVPAVATHLAAAMARLGVRTRAELIQLVLRLRGAGAVTPGEG